MGSLKKHRDELRPRPLHSYPYYSHNHISPYFDGTYIAQHRIIIVPSTYMPRPFPDRIKTQVSDKYSQHRVISLPMIKPLPPPKKTRRFPKCSVKSSLQNCSATPNLQVTIANPHLQRYDPRSSSIAALKESRPSQKQSIQTEKSEVAPSVLHSRRQYLSQQNLQKCYLRHKLAGIYNSNIAKQEYHRIVSQMRPQEYGAHERLKIPKKKSSLPIDVRSKKAQISSRQVSLQQPEESCDEKARNKPVMRRYSKKSYETKQKDLILKTQAKSEETDGLRRLKTMSDLQQDLYKQGRSLQGFVMREMPQLQESKEEAEELGEWKHHSSILEEYWKL